MGSLRAPFRSELAAKKASGGQRYLFPLQHHHFADPGCPVEAGSGRLSQRQAGAIRPRQSGLSLCSRKAAFGDYADPQYKLDAADVIVSLDADFLSGPALPGFHKLATDYARRRKDPAADMNRLYAVESTATTTGMKADHRLRHARLRHGRICRRLERRDGLRGGSPSGYSWTPAQQKFVADAGRRISRPTTASAVVIPGEQQPPAFISPPLHQPGARQHREDGDLHRNSEPSTHHQNDDLKALVGDMNAGKVDWLIMLNANPLYCGPGRSGFRKSAG